MIWQLVSPTLARQQSGMMIWHLDWPIRAEWPAMWAREKVRGTRHGIAEAE